tara:strand:- start:165 stop:377 length:213 start_codon:yes stop_codon:yes gene_type:complete
MNKQAAQINNNALHRDAVKQEIHALLCQDGPLHNGGVARRLGIDAYECREYLEEMVEAGEVEFKLWRYSV